MHTWIKMTFFSLMLWLCMYFLMWLIPLILIYFHSILSFLNLYFDFSKVQPHKAINNLFKSSPCSPLSPKNRYCWEYSGSILLFHIGNKNSYKWVINDIEVFVREEACLDQRVSGTTGYTHCSVPDNPTQSVQLVASLLEIRILQIFVSVILNRSKHQFTSTKQSYDTSL